MDKNNKKNNNNTSENVEKEVDEEERKVDEEEIGEKDEVVESGVVDEIGGEKVVGSEKVGVRRRLRNYLVDRTVGMVKRSGIPLDLACLILKIFHFRLPFDLFLYAWLGDVFTGLCLWIFVMTVFSFFLLLDGCVLSVIEYKLTGNSLNVMDIFLWLGGYELNYTNRYYATIIAAAIYLSLFFGVVFYRGGFSSDNINKLLYYLTFSYVSY